MYARRFISTVIVLSLSAAQLAAQHAAAKTDSEFAVLIDGLGSYSRPISTKLAQKFFDRGCGCLYR